ncbi:MAG: MerR family transcriptional regulator [Crocinitomicaceae bacterium]|nr:MerR family transcriptional regulator [Crocinitomicaceae bacterium]
MNILTEDELEYLKSGNFDQDYPNLLKVLNEPRFTMKDLGVTPRDATYWSKQGILPRLLDTSTTRRRYTLKQAIWIKLIQQLRSFEVSLNIIKLIKEHLLEGELNFRELLENEKVMEFFAKIERMSGDPEKIRDILNDPEVLEEMERERVDMFEWMILNTIIFRRDTSYLAFNDGQCMPYLYSKHDMMRSEVPNFDTIFKTPHILLSISQAYSQLIQDWSEKEWFENVSIVTEDERKVLKLLKEDKTKELKIFKKNGEIDRVIQVSIKDPDPIGQFSNHLVRNGYQTMTISTRNGKPVHFKNEVSMKMKDIPE